MSKEAIDKTLAAAKANSMKKKAELELAQLDERIATLTNELQEVCSKKDINFFSIIEKLDELAITERKQKQFKQILSEMFPD